MGADCGGVGGANYGPMYPCNSTGAILVLFILLVIILKACWL
ncbi:sporulation protein YjcZ [Paenibacillus sophorae]|nr:sporulation protein YjcZ [Paenibacillus sophorae]